MTFSKVMKDTKIHMIKPGTIMLIDDDAVFRNDLREIMEDEDYKVVGLDSANHALRYLQSQSWNWYPWLVITDLVMDGMGGYQLMRRLIELFPNKNIPMIVVSRLGSAEDMIEAEMAGASAYLKKPIEPQKLLATIKRVTTKEKTPELPTDQSELKSGR